MYELRFSSFKETNLSLLVDVVAHTCKPSIQHQAQQLQTSLELHDQTVHPSPSPICLISIPFEDAYDIQLLREI